MSRACGTYGGKEICIQVFGEEPEADCLEGAGIDGS